MAIRICPKCGGEVSAYSNTCIICGFNILPSAQSAGLEGISPIEPKERPLYELPSSVREEDLTDIIDDEEETEDLPLPDDDADTVESEKAVIEEPARTAPSDTIIVRHTAKPKRFPKKIFVIVLSSAALLFAIIFSVVLLIRGRTSSVKVGDTITIGHYEQDNNTSNGKEEIKWRVLAVEGNKALIISEYALDAKPYNTTYTNVTWETCTLRKWLNEDFLNAAFSTEEQKKIATTNVTADKNPSYSTNPGNATNDKIFLLSITEANKYFSNNEARKCAPTAYAKAQGAYTSSSNKTASGEATCWWWLRSPGYNQSYAALVYFDGSVNYFGYGVDFDDGCVRPALWINLDS